MTDSEEAPAIAPTNEFVKPDSSAVLSDVSEPVASAQASNIEQPAVVVTKNPRGRPPKRKNPPAIRSDSPILGMRRTRSLASALASATAASAQASLVTAKPRQSIHHSQSDTTLNSGMYNRQFKEYFPSRINSLDSRDGDGIPAHIKDSFLATSFEDFSMSLDEEDHSLSGPFVDNQLAKRKPLPINTTTDPLKNVPSLQGVGIDDLSADLLLSPSGMTNFTASHAVEYPLGSISMDDGFGNVFKVASSDWEDMNSGGVALYSELSARKIFQPPVTSTTLNQKSSPSKPSKKQDKTSGAKTSMPPSKIKSSVPQLGEGKGICIPSVPSSSTTTPRLDSALAPLASASTTTAISLQSQSVQVTSKGSVSMPGSVGQTVDSTESSAGKTFNRLNVLEELLWRNIPPSEKADMVTKNTASSQFVAPENVMSYSQPKAPLAATATYMSPAYAPASSHPLPQKSDLFSKAYQVPSLPEVLHQEVPLSSRQAVSEPRPVVMPQSFSMSVPSNGMSDEIGKMISLYESVGDYAGAAAIAAGVFYSQRFSSAGVSSEQSSAMKPVQMVSNNGIMCYPVGSSMGLDGSAYRGKYRCGRCGQLKVNHHCSMTAVVFTSTTQTVLSNDAIVDQATGKPWEGERYLSVSSQASIPISERPSNRQQIPFQEQRSLSQLTPRSTQSLPMLPRLPMTGPGSLLGSGLGQPAPLAYLVSQSSGSSISQYPSSSGSSSIRDPQP